VHRRKIHSCRETQLQAKRCSLCVAEHLCPIRQLTLLDRKGKEDIGRERKGWTKKGERRAMRRGSRKGKNRQEKEKKGDKGVP